MLLRSTYSSLIVPLLLLLLIIQLSLKQVMAMSNGVKENDGDDADDDLFYPTHVLEDDSRDGAGGIVWQDIGFEASHHTILEPFSFHVPNGRVCAILGPSGAGKTTLLKSLAAVLRHDGHVYVYNTLGPATEQEDNNHSSKTNNGDNVDHTLYLSPLHRHANQIAWLQQQDNFFSMLTVKETLQLAAYLELPHLPHEERQTIISSLMDGLGLHYEFDSETCRQTHLLSGGECRRLSVALELVSSEEVKVLLADEPTSGVDSGRAERVLGLVRTLAKTRNIPCLVTLHQPRSSIWNHLLDDCILMAQGGRVCYAGPTKTCLGYFEDLGYKCPPATNPAEFIIDLVTIDTEDAEQERIDRTRIGHLATAFRKHQRLEWNKHDKKFRNKKIAVLMEHPDDAKPVSLLRRRRGPFHWIPRFAALARRSWRQNSRNHAVNAFRLVASAGNAVLLAQIFPTVRGPVPTANSVADRVALLSFGAINMCMLAFMKAVELFGKEKPVVQREKRRHQYTALEYLLAKGLAELPLDIGFACVFTTVLKMASGICMSWKRLSAVFSLSTAAGVSLGFLLGSWSPNAALAQQAGIPLLVILMVVGIINPSGVDPNIPTPWFLQLLKLASPFAYCIEALCLGEYPGMVFLRQGFFRRLGNLRMGGLAFVKNGDQVIDALGLQNKSFEGTMKQLAYLTIANFFMSWIGLLVYGYHESPRNVEHPVTPRRSPAAVSHGGQRDPIAVPIRTRF